MSYYSNTGEPEARAAHACASAAIALTAVVASGRTTPEEGHDFIYRAKKLAMRAEELALQSGQHWEHDPRKYAPTPQDAPSYG